MNTLNDIYYSCVSSVPRWSQPEAEEFRRKQLHHLTISQLSTLVSHNIPARDRTKEALITFVIEQCRNLHHPLQSGNDIHRSVCTRYHSIFGAVVYRSLVKAFPPDAPVNHPAHLFLSPHFLPYLKAAISRCSSSDIEHLSAAVEVKTTTKQGSTVYRVNSSSSKNTFQSKDLLSLLSKKFQHDFSTLHALEHITLVETYLAENFQTFDSNAVFDGITSMIVAILQGRAYPCSVLNKILAIETEYHINSANNAPAPGSANERRRQQRRDARIQRVADELRELEDAKDSWPQPITDSIIQDCLRSYRESIKYEAPLICASCGAEDRLRTGAYYALPTLPPLEILRVQDEYVLKHTPLWRFTYIHQSLDGLLLEPKGLRALNVKCTDIEMYLCSECYGALSRTEMPRLALNNHLYRGELPPELQDITWVEEMACSLYRTTAHVARLYGSSSETEPLQLRGNTCAHPMNLFSNATTLPWAPSDLNELITIVFVGPRKLRPEDLKKLTPYIVRKPKIIALLKHLLAHNRLYIGLPSPDQRILDQYPEDGLLPGLEESIVYDHESDPELMFEEETSSFDQHPGELSDSKTIFLDKSGVYDSQSNSVPGRFMTSSALRNIAIASSPESKVPVHYERDPIPEYNNPDLFPGLFPTLFPLGIGGFEDFRRFPVVSLESHAVQLLDLADRSFRYHYFYVFVVLNLIQRRKAHLHTSFSVKSSQFSTIAPALLAVHPEVLCNLANTMRDEFNPALFSAEEKNALQLLKEVNTISAKIPGSQAAKVQARHEIRSYFAYFGLPTLFFTFNPSATHSPIFQVIYGLEDIDLDSDHPSIPATRSERARNVAKDPVAAADFFEFMYTCLFRDLFGWDFKVGKSFPQGGILGHLRAFYGTAELTERGQFHGHYLLWLRGAPNPSEVHARMEASEEYCNRFFTFFEGIIHQHLPDIDTEVDSSYEPRTEMPPHPAPKTLDDDLLLEAMNLDWQLQFDQQHKQIGERVQRHRCRPVCYKGRANQRECRFGFPHDLVEISRFETETHSIIFARKETDINPHNPYILVYTRHNHDLQCILSGKAAKAAMFYISDYITKMPLKTEQLLSLLSKAVASITSDDLENTPVGQAKRLLHRCLTHFGRNTQVHAQYAVRILRGLGDTMSSHRTVPLPSASLLFFVRKVYRSALSDPNSILDDDVPMQLAFDKSGQLRECSQVDHYFYRPLELEDINFYDFIRYFRCELKSKTITKHTPETRLGVLTRYPLCEGHLQHDTHELIRHTFPEQGDLGPELIPRVIGAKIPRKHSIDYKLFCLAHLKPFSVRNALISNSVDQDFASFSFSPIALNVMMNWEEIHECQDQREAERLRKQAQLLKSSTDSTLAQNFSGPDTVDLQDDDIDFVDQLAKLKGKDYSFERQFFLLQRNLTLSSWLLPPTDSVRTILQSNVQQLPVITTRSESLWKIEIKKQSDEIARARRIRSNPLVQVVVGSMASSDSSIAEVVCQNPWALKNASSSQLTELIGKKTFGPLTVNDIKQQVLSAYQLNSKQSEAFEIITETVIQRHVYKSTTWTARDPLRLFLTGPGGTGKTHVVKAVKDVLKYFGLEHTIRFVAPTGGAANLIDGTTIHKGLGIAIKKDKHGFERQAGDHDETEVSFSMSNSTRSNLRNEWKDVLILMVDEVSLLSLSLLAEIDAALRFAKEKPDDYFGALEMIFSGDMYQYPPSPGRSLYQPLTTFSKRKDEETMNRLGRLAWKSINAVINLVEQKRMEQDYEYGAAVARLRIRQCTEEDVNLFNSRVIKSSDFPDGVIMQSHESYLASIIVKTNKLRQRINKWKAYAVANDIEGLKLTACAAQDEIVYAADGKIPKKAPKVVPSKDLQEQLLALDTSSSHFDHALPGWLHLYIGMPVVLKGRNIDTNLGITNGARGYLRSFDISIDDNGFTHCTGCIVEFPDSKIHLEGLPPRCFPIKPTTWTCTTIINIPNVGPTKVQLTRFQLPIQAGFAVTGHSAQGQTLLRVLCNLKEGSWPAYVAASRAKSRHGLFITEPVTLADLNSPSIPYHLWFETRRFEILERNTLISWNFVAGSIQPVPDAEANDLHLFTLQDYRYCFPEDDSQSTPRKRWQREGEHSSAKRSRIDSGV